MTPPLRGRWAQGLQPRFFHWIIRDRLAAAERPGGFARTHRKVRRQEELIWLKVNGFTRIVSLLDSPHNLHAYDEADLVGEQLPLGRSDELTEHLPEVYARITTWLADPAEQLFVHHEEFGDRLLGFLAGLLLYMPGPVTEGPQAIQVIERLAGRNLGADGREIVAITLASVLPQRG